MRLPAAAIPAGSSVCRFEQEGWVKIKKVHNSTPRAGRIVWETDRLGKIEVGGADRIEVILP